jgi:hypothetical protein
MVDLLLLLSWFQTSALLACYPGAGDSSHFEVATLDHHSGAIRVDMSHRWDDPGQPRPRLHEDSLICDRESVRARHMSGHTHDERQTVNQLILVVKICLSAIMYIH